MEKKSRDTNIPDRDLGDRRARKSSTKATLREYVEHWVRTGDKIGAYLASHPNCKDRPQAKSNVYKFHKRYKDDIQILLKDSMEDNVHLANKALKDLLEHGGDSGKAKGIDIVFKNFLGFNDKVEHEIKKEDMTDAEILEKLAAMGIREEALQELTDETLH